MDRAEANALLAAKVQEAEAALAEAEKIAVEHKLSFEFSPAYGMGGTFYGELQDHHRDWYYMTEPGWVSSSQTC